MLALIWLGRGSKTASDFAVSRRDIEAAAYLEPATAFKSSSCIICICDFYAFADPLKCRFYHQNLDCRLNQLNTFIIMLSSESIRCAASVSAAASYLLYALDRRRSATSNSCGKDYDAAYPHSERLTDTTFPVRIAATACCLALTGILWRLPNCNCRHQPPRQLINTSSSSRITVSAAGSAPEAAATAAGHCAWSELPGEILNTRPA